MQVVLQVYNVNNQNTQTLLDICVLASFLLNQIYKQDVGPNVSTRGYVFCVPWLCAIKHAFINWGIHAYLLVGEDTYFYPELALSLFPKVVLIF